MQSRTERTRRLTLSAMFATLALIFTYVEVLIPYNLGIPGVKLGLANLVILIALYRMDVRYALMIDLIHPAGRTDVLRSLRHALFSGGRNDQSIGHGAPAAHRSSHHCASMAGGAPHFDSCQATQLSPTPECSSTSRFLCSPASPQASASASSHISSTASSPHSCSKEAFHERIHHRAPDTNESALYRLVHRSFHRLPRH